MGPIVRLVGSGIGLAAEAIAARKASKAEKEKAQAQSSSNSLEAPPKHSPSPSRGPSPDPPAYSTLDPSSADYGLVETADEHHARQLIDKGHAEPWEEPNEIDQGDSEGQHDDEAYVGNPIEASAHPNLLQKPSVAQEYNILQSHQQKVHNILELER